MNPAGRRSESRFNSARRDGALAPSPSRPPAYFPSVRLTAEVGAVTVVGGCDNGPIIGMNRKFVSGPRERRTILDVDGVVHPYR